MSKMEESEKVKEWNKDLEPLVKFALGKKGVKTKSAAEVGKKKVEYFRGKDLCTLLIKHEQLIGRKCKKALDLHCGGVAPATSTDVIPLGSELIKHGFIVKAQCEAARNSTPTADDTEGSKKMKKWPERLIRMDSSKFDPDGFYIILYEGSRFWSYFWLTLLVLAIVAGSAFQAWPLWLKIGAWYLLVVFLSLYFCLELTRLSSFTGGWILGVDFWIFPNLNDDECGFLDAFRPYYSFERRKDSFTFIGIRLLTLGIIAVAVQEISRTHSISDVKDFIEGSYIDIIDWGKDRLMALPNAKPYVPSLAHLEKEEEEELAREKLEAAGEGDEGDENIDDKEEVLVDENGEVRAEEVD